MNFCNLKPLKATVVTLVVLLALSCNSPAGRNASAATDAPGDTVPRPESAMELVVPEAPATMTDPQEMAGYVAIHFWDNMDFSDTIRVNDDRFMEHHFANYFSVFPYVSADDAVKAAGRLVKLSEVTPASLGRVLRVTRRFLTSPNSSMRDEELYYIFLEAASKSDSLDDASRVKVEDGIKEVLKNRQGTPAADFKVIDNRGKATTLYGEAKAGQCRLVVFYDPECSHCHEIIEELKQLDVLNYAVEAGLVKVMAVYADGDSEVWKQARDSMPENWLNCMSLGGEIVEKDTYSLPAMPVIYLIAPDNSVILKDPTLPLLADWLYNEMSAE